MPASYSGLQFNMFPKSAQNTVFPRPLYNNPMVRKKKEKKSRKGRKRRRNQRFVLTFAKELVPFTQLVKVRGGNLVWALPSIRFS